MEEKTDRDKAIDALREFNTLKTEWSLLCLDPPFPLDPLVVQTIRKCNKGLCSAIERAYEILNNG